MRYLFPMIASGVILAAGGPIENLKPGEWYAVPNSRMDAVKPNPLPPSNSGYDAVMGAWNSGAYDTQRDRFLVWGGGHCDYAGNEIYAFDMNTLQWSRAWGPTPNADIPSCGGTNIKTYGDGNPSARHTYDGEEYLPNLDALLIVGGPYWGSSGGGGTILFNFGTQAWTWGDNEGDGRNGDESAYDPVTGHLFMRGLYWVSEYDPVANSWTARCNCSPANGGGWWCGYGTGEIDPKRRLMIFAGGSCGLGVYNIATNQFTNGQPTSGDNGGMVSAAAPGLAYDPVTESMVAWKGGPDVHTLDPSTWTWTKKSAASTNTVTPTAGLSSGTYGRFRYVPSKNVFVCVNHTYENVFVYRHTADSSAPQWYLDMIKGPGTAEESADGGQGRKAEGKGQIQISPNPAHGARMVDVKLPPGVREYRVFDLKGKLTFRSSPEKVNVLSRLAPGLYVVSTVSRGSVVTAKFAVIR